MGSVGARAGAASEDEEIRAAPIRIDLFGNLSARIPNNLPMQQLVMTKCSDIYQFRGVPCRGVPGPG
eukprot:6401910-Pyramimonas_sp.AAC.1